MAMHPARTKRALIPIGTSFAVLVVATSAYAITGSRPTQDHAAVSAAAVELSTAASTTVISKTSPATQPAAKPTTTTLTSASPYIDRVGTATDTSPSAVDTIKVSRAQAGSTLVTTVLLLGTASGTPQVTDSEGDSYKLQVNQTDASGNELLLFVATKIRGLAATDTVSISYPAATAHAIAIDEYAGRTAVDQSVSATGIGTIASTGRTAKTAAGELAVAALAGITGATTLSDYTKLPPLSVNGASVTIAWRFLTNAGNYSARGTADGPWLAGLTTLD